MVRVGAPRPRRRARPARNDAPGAHDGGSLLAGDPVVVAVQFGAVAGFAQVQRGRARGAGLLAVRVVHAARPAAARLLLSLIRLGLVLLGLVRLGLVLGLLLILFLPRLLRGGRGGGRVRGRDVFSTPIPPVLGSGGNL